MFSKGFNIKIILKPKLQGPRPATFVGFKGVMSLRKDDNEKKSNEKFDIHTMHLSEDGKQFIYEHEKFISHLYPDKADNCTIGYGHKIHDGPCNRADKKIFK